MQRNDKNKVRLTFGEEGQSYNGLKIDVNIKMDVKIADKIPNLPKTIQVNFKNKIPPNDPNLTNLALCHAVETQS